MKKIAGIFLITFACIAHAAIYVKENTNGSIEYSDTPTEQSKKMDIPTVNSITVPNQTSQSPSKTPTSAKSEQDNDTNNEATSDLNTYTTFQIVSPKNEETIQNQPVIPVVMNIEPNMLPGDKIQLMLDDQPVGTPTATSYQEIGLVERGTHTLYAAIINDKDQVIKKTTAITIYVHRNSTITSPTSR